MVSVWRVFVCVFWMGCGRVGWRPVFSHAQNVVTVGEALPSCSLTHVWSSLIKLGPWKKQYNDDSGSLIFRCNCHYSVVFLILIHSYSEIVEKQFWSYHPKTAVNHMDCWLTCWKEWLRLHLIINQSLVTRIPLIGLRLQKWFHFSRKEMIIFFNITGWYLYFHLYRNMPKNDFSRVYDFFQSKPVYMTASMAYKYPFYRACRDWIRRPNSAVLG